MKDFIYILLASIIGAIIGGLILAKFVSGNGRGGFNISGISSMGGGN